MEEQLHTHRHQGLDTYSISIVFWKDETQGEPPSHAHIFFEEADFSAEPEVPWLLSPKAFHFPRQCEFTPKWVLIILMPINLIVHQNEALGS